MWLPKFVFFSFILASYTQDYSEEFTTEFCDEAELAEGEKKLSETILSVLEHFKKPDPMGIPGVDIPDPYPVPDMTQSPYFGTTVYFKDTAVHGISKFRILFINADVGTMEVQGAMSVENLQALGNYTLSTFFDRKNGPYSVNVTGMTVTARANLGVERDGKLRARDINIDMIFKNIAVDFQNLGLFGNMFQGLINSVGPFIFNSIKPHILKESLTKMRTELNKKLDEIAGDIKFPNTVSPLDMVLIDVRNKMHEMKWDPYHVEDYNTTVSIFDINLSNTWIIGVSSFQRVGNISMKLENKTVVVDFAVGTEKVEGRTHWDISTAGKFISRAGAASFSVEYMRMRAILGQPLDTREKPQFRDLELEIGNIQIRSDGAGTLDYVIEFAVNVLPNLLRYQIVDAIKGPLKMRVQQEFDYMNVEEAIKEQLPRIEEFQESGFKLEHLKTQNERYDDDEFFNF